MPANHPASVSILMPCLNALPYLDEAISSVLGELPVLELLVADGGKVKAGSLVWNVGWPGTRGSRWSPVTMKVLGMPSIGLSNTSAARLLAGFMLTIAIFSVPQSGQSLPCTNIPNGGWSTGMVSMSMPAAERFPLVPPSS
jgi:hypothetical protein